MVDVYIYSMKSMKNLTQSIKDRKSYCSNPQAPVDLGDVESDSILGFHVTSHILGSALELQPISHRNESSLFCKATLLARAQNKAT